MEWYPYRPDTSMNTDTVITLYVLQFAIQVKDLSAICLRSLQKLKEHLFATSYHALYLI